jgi:RHS repeat-associated protein
VPDLYSVAGEVGYQLENRSFSNASQRYKFTGKERDKDLESNYDYFGARYYDNRIGRWGQVEPLLDKFLNWSPYTYTFCNPVIAKDIDGRDAIFIHFVNYRIGVSGKGVPGIGHAGVLLIDNKSGEVKYYDFGRYGKNDKGIVRNDKTLGIKLDQIPLGSDGKLDQTAISDRLKTISESVGKGSLISGAYIESDKYKEMNEYANGLFEETNSSSSDDTYDKITNNCATFASDVIKQDQNVNGAPDPWVFMPIHFSAWYQTFYPSVYYDNTNDKYDIGNGAEGADK